MIEDKALLNEYLSEAEELLDSLLADLDSLSTKPGINLINRIFRKAHSLKGLSGMMGLGEVQSLAHEFEDILDDLRLGQLTLDERTIGAIQEAGAGLAALVGGAARASVSEDDFDRLRQLLASIGAPAQRTKGGGSAIASLALTVRERTMLSEYEERRIAENARAGRLLYSLTVQFEAGRTFDRRFRELTARLEEAGEIVATLPTSSSAPALVALKLIVATRLKEPKMKALGKPFGASVARLERSPWQRAGAALRGVGRRQKDAATDVESPPAEVTALLPPAFAKESLQPLSQSVRVELMQIDELAGLTHELSIEIEKLTSMARRFLKASGLGARERFDLRFNSRRIERDFLELEERLVELRMVSLAQTFTRAARLTGRLARELGKSVSVEVAGRDTHLDKIIVDRIADCVYHVLRNAVDHGLEPPDRRRAAGKSARGKIRIEGMLEGTRAVIAITDDGSGIDSQEVRRQAVEAGLIESDVQLSEEETLRLILRPGFSTAEQVSEVSGRGVGLDAVERTIRELGGEVRISSEKGKWTKFELAVPTTLAMLSAFMVRASEWRYAINVGQIAELLYLGREDIIGRDGKRSIEWRGSVIPLVELRYLLGLGGARLLHQALPSVHESPQAPQIASQIKVPVFVTRAGDRSVAVAVEQFEGQREIVVKSLGSLAHKIRGVTGAVDLEGGDVALVLDLPSLLMFRSLRL